MLLLLGKSISKLSIMTSVNSFGERSSLPVEMEGWKGITKHNSIKPKIPTQVQVMKMSEHILCNFPNTVLGYFGKHGISEMKDWSLCVVRFKYLNSLNPRAPALAMPYPVNVKGCRKLNYVNNWPKSVEVMRVATAASGVARFNWFAELRVSIAKLKISWLIWIV